MLKNSFSTDNVLTAENQQERLDKQIPIEEIPKSLAWYIAGFVDGEGSFNISLRKKRDYKLSWQPVLSFNVSQKDRSFLDRMQQIFGCGIIKRRRDGLHSFDVTTPSSLETRIIPFFRMFPFFSMRKIRNFQLFIQAVSIMTNKRHVIPQGLYELLLIREQINKGKGRTRKYSIDDVYQESSETIRQAPKIIGEDIVRTHKRL